ncbi:DNA modification methylase [Bradyrhizobium sp. USDA 326]
MRCARRRTIGRVTASKPPSGSFRTGRSDTTQAAQKPVECMRRPILHYTLQGEAVYVPFLGSVTP